MKLIYILSIAIAIGYSYSYKVRPYIVLYEIVIYI